MTKEELLFWAKVRIGDGCWEWTAGSDKRGYGVFGVGRSSDRASRVSWRLTHGPVPSRLCVLHRCDNPACVRPSHLFLGTRADNNADMVAKGRHSIGERNAQAKLTRDDVVRIRQLHGQGHSQGSLGRQFGVSQTQISRIIERRKWRSVP